VIARSQGAELLEAAVDGPFADGGGIGPRHAAARFRQIEVFLPAVTPLQTPPCPLFDDLPKLLAVDSHGSCASHAGRHPLEEHADELLEARPHLPFGKVRDDETHAAVDVEPDAARGDDASVRDVHRSDAADGKPVTRMPVGHAEGVADDAGQAGDVGDLLEDGVIHIRNEFLGAVDPGRHAHARLEGDRNLPQDVAHFLKHPRNGHVFL